MLSGFRRFLSISPEAIVFSTHNLRDSMVRDILSRYSLILRKSPISSSDTFPSAAMQSYGPSLLKEYLMWKASQE